ncbi:MAG TPA: IPT/TIG domain-containing protein [Solirubrobacterales bacterium]|nr:IPT/TIG domain-containing protein [Solirubrobacterales bacterium]
MKSLRWTLALAVVLALGTTTAAQAAPVTFGASLASPFEAGEASGGSGTFANLAFGEPGARPTSPVTGVIISWRLGDANGPFRLRVLRPNGGAYTAVGSSAIEVATGGPGSGIQTFTAAVPIQAGDLIGLDINNGNKIGVHRGDPADVAAVWIPPILDGATLPFAASENELEVAFNATVQPAPTVALIAPASGSIKGGSTVTIAGTDFANVTGVSFGSVPAKSFAVTSEGQMTAVAPAAKKAGKVDVTVTTIAGTTPVVATDKFNYKACVVPNLQGKKLKAAKKKLHKALCKVGKVKLKKGVTAKSGKVVKQGPKAGKQLAPGTKVNVTLG